MHGDRLIGKTSAFEVCYSTLLLETYMYYTHILSVYTGGNSFDQKYIEYLVMSFNINNHVMIM